MATPSRCRSEFPERIWRLAQTLLRHNTDPDIQSGYGEITLHVASRNGNTNVARLLLEKCVDVNARRKDDSTLLHLVSEDGWLEVPRVLIEHGADIGAEDT